MSEGIPYRVTPVLYVKGILPCLLYSLIKKQIWFMQDDGNAWRQETFALLLEAWVAMAEDSEVTAGANPSLRKGMEDATLALYEQYVAHELTVR